MGGLKGLGRFVLVLGGAVVVLRLIHVAVPQLVPDTRSGPYAVGSLEEARDEAGFIPLVPSYRPVALGEFPPVITFQRIPAPTLTLEWRGRNRLRITESLAESAPELPDDARPLDGVPDAVTWERDGIRHILLERAGVRARAETDLPPDELRRIAVSLGPTLSSRRR